MGKLCWETNVAVAKRRHGADSDEYKKALDNPATCILPYRHRGAHRWTPDEAIHFVVRSRKGQ